MTRTYAPAVEVFETPRGHLVTMHYRTDSSDWNTLYSALNEDEYGLRSRHLTGSALDIGAHIGAVAVGLAIDNPDLIVVAVEPVPDNARLLRLNVAAYGLTATDVNNALAANDFISAIGRTHFRSNTPTS